VPAQLTAAPTAVVGVAKAEAGIDGNGGILARASSMCIPITTGRYQQARASLQGVMLLQLGE